MAVAGNSPAMGALQFRRQRVEQRLRQRLGELQACRFLIRRLGLAANQQPHALADGIAGIDGLLRPQGGVEKRIEDLGRRPAGISSNRVRAADPVPATGGGCGRRCDRRHRAPPAGWCGCARTPPRDAGRCVGHHPDRAAARECRRAPHDARDCRAPRPSSTMPPPRIVSHTSTINCCSGVRVHASLADRDRLLALEHLADQRMFLLTVLPMHVAQRRAVVARARRRLRDRRGGQAQAKPEEAREPMHQARPSLLMSHFGFVITLLHIVVAKAAEGRLWGMRCRAAPVRLLRYCRFICSYRAFPLLTQPGHSMPTQCPVAQLTALDARRHCLRCERCAPSVPPSPRRERMLECLDGSRCNHWVIRTLINLGLS